MRKNKMLRMASALLILVLLTTSVVGGTFAKYVTTAEGTDTARVAKWGVKFEVATGLFAESYKNAAVTDNTATVKVDTTGTNLVAPGTTGTGFSITNTTTTAPEVSYEVKIKLDKDAAKVPTLKYTPAGGTEATYEPIKFSVYNGTTPIKENISLSDLTSAFDGSKVIYKYDVYNGKYYVDSNLDGTPDTTPADAAPNIKIKWEWAFETGADENAKALNDKLDTVLGNTAAGTTGITTYEGGTVSNINTEVKLPWTMTATQID